jgi:hypothetical protein
MTAHHLPFFKNRLMELSRGLYQEHCWDMPHGIEGTARRDPANFTLAEWQCAKRLGTDPRWLKQSKQECWASSDNRRAFERSFSERGLFLTKGDKRGFVVLDHDGEVYSLPPMLDVKTKDVRARLGDGVDLPGDTETRKTIGEKMSPAIRRHIADSRARFEKRAATLGEYKAEMTRLHRQARDTLEDRQKTEAKEETRERAARLPRGVMSLWHRLTGKYQAIRKENEAAAEATQARHADELHTLIETQHSQRSMLQDRFTELRQAQARQLSDLRGDVGRYLRFTRGQDAPGRALEADTGLKLGRQDLT